MSSLGDLFPQKWKDNLAIENLKVGAVIRIPVPDTVPPKIKRLIVVAIEEQKVLLATVFINSEINPFVLNTIELQNFQHKLEASKYSFLDHDSYADCSKLKERNFENILALMRDRLAYI